MKTALVYDSETTNLPIWKEPSDHPGQPHIVELAAKLVNLENREVINQMCVIIKPDGWAWDDSATTADVAFKTHGITMERAMDEGIPEKDPPASTPGKVTRLPKPAGTVKTPEEALAAANAVH
jgi:DNA polymerase-3 subunit epsilon